MLTINIEVCNKTQDHYSLEHHSTIMWPWREKSNSEVKSSIKHHLRRPDKNFVMIQVEKPQNKSSECLEKEWCQKIIPHSYIACSRSCNDVLNVRNKERVGYPTWKLALIIKLGLVLSIASLKSIPVEC